MKSDELLNKILWARCKKERLNTEEVSDMKLRRKTPKTMPKMK